MQSTSTAITVGAHVRDGNEWIYQLVPAHALPTIDLAVSVKKRFFRASGNKMFGAIIRHGRLSLVGFVFTTLCYTVVMLVPVSTGKYLAVGGVLSGTPAIIVAIGSLRYDMLKLLARTYDTWFLATVVLIVSASVSTVLGSIRGLLMIPFWVGSWPNVCLDATLTGMREVALLNILCTIAAAVMAMCVAFDLGHELRSFEVLRLGNHGLAVKHVIVDSILNVAALMLRNNYRRRKIATQGSHGLEIECVSYRCRLKLVQRRLCLPSLTRTFRTDDRTPKEGDAMTKLRYVPALRRIDVRHSVLSDFLTPATKSCHLGGMVCIGLTGIILTIGSGAALVRRDPHKMTPNSIAFVGLVVGFCLTILNQVVVTAAYHWELLTLLCTSFDFIFLDVQLTFVHFCICDFLRWNTTNVILVACSWMWIHWILLFDALTPPIRKGLQLRPCFVKIVIVYLLGNCVFTIFHLFFADPPVDLFDRLLWSGEVMGRQVQYRLIPQFYSAFFTSMFWLLRYFWGYWTAEPDELVLINGRVVFTNTLHSRKTPSHSSSKPHHSVTPTIKIQAASAQVGH